MNPLARWIPGLLLTVLVAGCANYDIRPFPSRELEAWGTRGDGSQKAAKSGYIIYQPELYFVVAAKGEDKEEDKSESESKDGKNKTTQVLVASAQSELTVTPIYLPNPRKPYRVTTRNFLAKADFSFTFEEGWKLTKLEDKSDNSAVASALAAQLKDLLVTAGLGAGGTNVGLFNKDGRPVLLYRPDYDPTNGLIKGFVPVRLNGE